MFCIFIYLVRFGVHQLCGILLTLNAFRLGNARKFKELIMSNSGILNYTLR